MCAFFTSSKCVLVTYTFKHTYTASASGFRYLVVCGEVHWRPAPIGSLLPALVLIGDLSARPSSSHTQTHTWMHNPTHTDAHPRLGVDGERFRQNWVTVAKVSKLSYFGAVGYWFPCSLKRRLSTEQPALLAEFFIS